MNVGNCNPVPAPQCRSPVKLQNGNGSCSSWQNGASGQGAVQNFCGNMSRERRSESREIIKKLPQEDDGRGAGGPDALQTSSPVRKQNRVDTNPHAALRALLVGLRPPTPQSPERLRSTPFDCVAIAPCCFAERKAVLSHALAALTALKAREKTEVLLHAKHALTALKVCEKA